MGRPAYDRTKDKGSFRDELLRKIDFGLEFTELLGSGTGTKRKCFNGAAHKNSDNNPSLSFNGSTGSWRCHSCGEKGDLFSLYVKVRKLPYPDVLKLLYQRYGLWGQVAALREERGDYKQPIIKDPNIIADHIASRDVLRSGENHDAVRILLERYGITKESIVRWDLGWFKHRLEIPIWRTISYFGAAWGPGQYKMPDFVNLRRHDIRRTACHWQHTRTGAVQKQKPETWSIDAVIQQRFGDWNPVYAEQGKVLGVKGYNSCYLYPFEVAYSNSAFYLVGGELKAILLNQLGIPAVTFTAGEGNIAWDFLPLLFGKRVRILMDLDEAGVQAADRLSLALATHGVYVEKAIWPDQVKAELPKKGDITDLLKACAWNIEALDLLEYVPVEPVPEEDSFEKEIQESTLLTIRWNETETKPFSELVDPNSINTWIRLGALISGRGETPYVVPRYIEVSCAEGKIDYRPICQSCRLPNKGFCDKKSFSTEEQLEMVGQSKDQLDTTVRKVLGIPRTCPSPVFKGQYSSVENINITPTVDHAYAGDMLGQDKDEYRYHPAYLLKEERVEIKENSSYEFLGKIVPEPKNNKFTFAVREFRPLENDILNWTYQPAEWSYLRASLGIGDLLTPQEIVNRLTADLRENVVAIYSQDRMIQSILLSMFLPFSFRVGQFYNERICPTVMILGDTTVGKSTATQRLLRFFGAGRMANAGGRQTFVGLIGGNLQIGSNRMTFSWGLIPTSHKGFVALDEYHKLDLDSMGSITNTISSGIAERLTANGVRRTKSWVRLLYLCNPREFRGVNRPLTSYGNPLDAALQVCGTVQDLGRVDYVHIQFQHSGDDIYFAKREEVEHNYTKSAARTHLQWAWSRKPEDFEFEDEEYLLHRTKELADKYGHHTLLIPAHLRFKLAKFAIAYALLTLSWNELTEKVPVTNTHIDLAYQWFDEGYAPHIEANTRLAATLPAELVKVLDQVVQSQSRRLRIFCTSDCWSVEDIQDAMGKQLANEFLDLTQFEYRMLTRRGRMFYPVQPEVFGELIASYLTEREKEKARNNTESTGWDREERIRKDKRPRIEDD